MKQCFYLVTAFVCSAMLNVVAVNHCYGNGPAAAEAPMKASSEETLTPGYHMRVLVHHGGERKYGIYVPERYDGKLEVPLVLDFHGFWASASWISKTSGFKEKSELVSQNFPQGFIVVYPEAIAPRWGWNVRECCGLAEAFNVDDEGFVFAVIDDVKSRWKIDSRRIYLTGHSNGSMLAQLMTSKYPEFFAAVAPVSASSVLWKYYAEPAEDRPMPVIMYTGLDDECVFDPETCSSFASWAGQTFVSVPQDYVGLDQNFELWAARNGCTTRTPREDPSNIFNSAHTATYTGCFNNVQVVKWAVEASHNDVYDNGESELTAVDIAATAWDFMSQFSAEYEEIFHDNFEKETLSSWRASDDSMSLYTYNTVEHCARLAKQQQLERTFDLSEYGRVVLRYQWRTKNLDTGEYGYVEWSPDGTNWTEIERVRRSFDTTWSSSSIRVDAGGGLSSFHLRFRVDGSNDHEYFYVDNVVLAVAKRDRS